MINPINLQQFELVVLSDNWPFGEVTTPGTNTYGSYVTSVTSAMLTDDAYGITIWATNVASAAEARDCLANVGVDPAGGTSFSVLIADLLISCAGSASASNGDFGGIFYYFPIRIKAGSSVGFATSVNNATVGAATLACQLYCKPSGTPPRAGTYVRTFGSVAASSRGTSVTPNSAGSKSAYVQLGSAAADMLWYWNLGVGCNNAAMSANASMWDLAIGDATNKRNVIVDQLVNNSDLESMAFTSYGAHANAGSGDLIYARAGGAAASPTGMSAIAYGVGG